jgi:hypothetical protein
MEHAMTIRTGPNNHVEMVHRPGEAHLVKKLLTLLGFEPVVSAVPFAGTRWISSPDKILWVSEVTPEQWAFEQWLQAQLKESGTDESRSFHENLKRQPQKYAHFGLGLTSLNDWQGVVARLKEAAASDPELKDRITLPLVVRPEDKGSVADDSGGKMGRTLYQAFLRTDILASGLLTMGQAIEIQHYRENDPAWTGEEALQAIGV